MIEEITNEIAQDKEILKTLPRNNIKNTKIYLQKLQETINKYENYKNQTYTEIKTRTNNIKQIPVNNKINELKEQINNIKNIMYLYNDYKLPISKMKIDILIHQLNHFDKLSLDKVNECIYKLITIYKETKIDISLDDFKYSIFAYEYMNEYLNELQNNNYNNTKLNECFEKIYWKCPDLIIHLKLCFISLYYKNIKKQEKYLNELKEENTFDINKYYELVKEYDETINTDPLTILNSFITKELNIKDYEEDKINKLYAEIITNQTNDTSLDIKKLSYTLKEYNSYLEYSYLTLDIKKIYEQKKTYKDCSKKTLKDIYKKEKTLSKYNKKLFKIWNKFNKENKINKYSIALNNLIKEINNSYNELDKDLFKEKIYNNINDTSTIIDVLSLCYSDYNYLTNIIKENNEGITDIEISKIIDNLFNLLASPYNTIINNMPFLTTEDLQKVITDKYNLTNINITSTNLETNNIINYINTINTIITYQNIIKSNLKVKDIELVLESTNIL